MPQGQEYANGDRQTENNIAKFIYSDWQKIDRAWINVSSALPTFLTKINLADGIFKS